MDEWMILQINWSMLCGSAPSRALEIYQGWLWLITKETLNALCSVLMYSALMQEAARAREKCKGKRAVECFSLLFECFSCLLRNIKHKDYSLKSISTHWKVYQRKLLVVHSKGEKFRASRDGSQQDCSHSETIMICINFNRHASLVIFSQSCFVLFCFFFFLHETIYIYVYRLLAVFEFYYGM